ncbi:hypothetical protein BDQ12DRAFT_723467 [Crucibulum laeve]|uniref:Uncharacterized protein n=1 Tax=Crucibulum laeve TaxID=68775 RepID=A0A5C3LY97_9AGAR|nr:hypothetical protein BDQ12DRAFT_723467 [Crucibulum laeve]
MNDYCDLDSSSYTCAQRVGIWLQTLDNQAPLDMPIFEEHFLDSPYNYGTSSSSSSSSSISETELWTSPNSSYIPPLVLDRPSSDRYTYSEVYPLFSSGANQEPMSTLPDPVYNPLVTFNPDEIEEEYCRVLGIRNWLQRLHEEKELEQSLRVTGPPWEMTDVDWKIAQQLFQSSMNIQRANSAAEYIVDFSQTYGVPVDFYALSMRLFRPVYESQVLLPPVEIYNGRDVPLSMQAANDHGHASMHPSTSIGPVYESEVLLPPVEIYDGRDIPIIPTADHRDYLFTRPLKGWQNVLLENERPDQNGDDVDMFTYL